ncbi:transglycosylase family protein [Streptomyces sp. 150FB]|uniref:LysM peptidoglycan-binding domain-containing protein n=1 Tax=Streptomyces sp. 150FB TaxID=1576605 RepID=UPI001F29147E|nr:transglycosylase family protein [Streptomyces sp. 150FB]
MTGSALAIPLFAASGASAADASTWDSVAECESGGVWSADLGNGFYGGLQLSQIVWDQYGGDDYAPRPDLASRSQQIAIAEKVLDSQGPGVWSSCAPIAGLTDGGPAPDVDPGGPVKSGGDTSAKPSHASPSHTSPSSSPSSSPSPSSSASAPGSSDAPDPGPDGDGADSGQAGPGTDTGEGAGAPSGTPSGDPSASPSSSDTSTTPAPGASASTDPVTGKHRGGVDPADTAHAGADADRDSGRHASRSDGPEPRSGDVAGDAGGAGGTDAAHDAYKVRPGDNLWDIAETHHVAGGWNSIYEANKATVGSDPDLILPGQSLDLSAK